MENKLNSVMHLQSMGKNTAHDSNVSLLAGGWSTRLCFSAWQGWKGASQKSPFPRERQREGDDRGVTEQSKQGTAFLYAVVVRLPWRTAVVITLTSKSEFIDYKEPAASL